MMKYIAAAALGAALLAGCGTAGLTPTAKLPSRIQAAAKHQAVTGPFREVMSAEIVQLETILSQGRVVYGHAFKSTHVRLKTMDTAGKAEVVYGCLTEIQWNESQIAVPQLDPYVNGTPLKQLSLKDVWADPQGFASKLVGKQVFYNLHGNRPFQLNIGGGSGNAMPLVTELILANPL